MTIEASAAAAQTLAGLERAWNLGDGAAFGEAFADDADFVDIRGDHHRGVEVVGAGHQALFDSLYAGSVIQYRLETARMITPECLVAVARATLDTPAGPAAGVSHARFTAVLTAHGGEWWVAALHNGLTQADA
jgi:uncharacterized protein (TIGR02246 family)